MYISPQTFDSISTRTHFSAAASVEARTNDQSSTITPAVCRREQTPPESDDDDWGGASQDNDVKEVVDDNIDDGEYFRDYADNPARTGTTIL